MNSCTRRHELGAYLDGELAPAQHSALESHLAECSECRDTLEALRRLHQTLGALPPIEPSAPFEAGFWARLARSEDRSPSWARRLGLALAGAGVAGLAVWALWLARPGEAPLPQPELHATAEPPSPPPPAVPETKAPAAGSPVAKPTAGEWEVLEESEEFELALSTDPRMLEVLDVLERWDGG